MSADRKLDVTLCLHLEGNDTITEPETLVSALRAELDGLTVFSPERPPMGAPALVMRVVSTDEPIHLHTVQRGKRA